MAKPELQVAACPRNKPLWLPGPKGALCPGSDLSSGLSPGTGETPLVQTRPWVPPLLRAFSRTSIVNNSIFCILLKSSFWKVVPGFKAGLSTALGTLNPGSETKI